MWRKILCETYLHIANEGVHVDAFDRAPVGLMVLVHPSATARFSEVDPVGRSIAGAAKPRIDDCLQKPRSIAVKLQPFSGSTASKILWRGLRKY